MGSKLKKKSKPTYEKMFNVSKGTKKKELNEDNAITKVTDHVSYAIYLALHDVLGFKAKRLRKFYDGTIRLKLYWSDEDTRTDMMLNYCAKKELDIYGWVKSIPMMTKIELARPSAFMGMDRYVDAAILISGMTTAIVLKEEFRISKQKIFDVLEHMKNTLDAFVKKQPVSKKPYLTNDMIRRDFLENVKIDLATGEMAR